MLTVGKAKRSAEVGKGNAVDPERLYALVEIVRSISASNRIEALP